MKRTVLSPPRPIRLEAGLARRAAGAARLVRDRLGSAVPARERRRPWFHPRRGWLRRFERWFSHALSRRIYPAIPGLHWPYDRILRRGLSVSETTIELPVLPAGFAGTRLLLITDIHAGPFVSPTVLRETFERLLQLRPDAILLGGDLVNARTVEFRDHREAFSLLRAPLGVYAVPGNHDHYTHDIEALGRMVEQAGITMLCNRATTLRRDGAELSLAGVDDLLMGRPDLDAALAGTRSPVLLLSHSPDLLFDASRRRVALMLSGHTHAGQVRIPGLPVLVRQSRYRLDEGRFRAGETELVVSRGLGAVGLPLRIACPPEAVLITLA